MKLSAQLTLLVTILLGGITFMNAGPRGYYRHHSRPYYYDRGYAPFAGINIGGLSLGIGHDGPYVADIDTEDDCFLDDNGTYICPDSYQN